jgi:hypothetical protein
MNKNHFIILIRSIQRYMPILSLSYIIVTYLVTALIAIFFVQMNPIITVSGALTIQFGRMIVVGMDFLLTSKTRVYTVIAVILTGVALFELFFTLSDIYNGSQFTANYLFLATIIVLGLIAEVLFVQKAQEVLSIEEKKAEANNSKGEVPLVGKNANKSSRMANFQSILKQEKM